MSNIAKNFDILATGLSIFLHNYFNNSTKLFSDLAKILDLLAKLFFPCTKQVTRATTVSIS